ncbi:MAG: HAMP domain-containing histidine kinase [Lachnospiraceae bacterium]|nr:HAMP domain-containing histidine kinase [Lachnospiraceae bacterium]
MGQVKKRTSRRISLKNSLKWRILLYMPIPILLALVGAYQIGYAVNDWQAWYAEYVFTGSDMDLLEEDVDDNMVVYDGNNYTVYQAEDGVLHYVFHNIKSAGTPGEKIGYWLVTSSQVVLTTLWVGLCLFTGGYIYYKRELEKSIRLLLNSADKIANNCLDFTMEEAKPNELGMVCDAFEKMRCSLYETSQENFRILEERRRLNAAFAHDMRNPVTVLKGYVDLLERYIPEERISREKEMEIIGMVHRQVLRLENYVQKMSAVQKLEDITPAYENIDYGEFISLCTETAKQIDGRVSVRVESGPETIEAVGTIEAEGTDSASKESTMAESFETAIHIDKDLVLEVMENLLVNASVHTKDRILLTITNRGTALELCVEDNGCGFSEEALKFAGNPFYREENGKSGQRPDGHFCSQRGIHFGLGLYICKLICEKCGGSLHIGNSADSSGGVVTAVFGL